MLQMRPTEMIEFGAAIVFLDFYCMPYIKDQLRAGEQNDSVDLF